MQLPGGFGGALMQVAVFPESWRSNPMLDLWEKSLKERGITFTPVGSDYPTFRWLVRQRRQVNVLHFHWLDYLYLRASPWLSVGAFFKLCLKLVLARLLGYRIVWTMHNALPHERTATFIDYFTAFLFARLAHSIIVHCEAGRRELRRRFHRQRNVFMAYHGNYICAYPNSLSRPEARLKLGFHPQQQVYLFIGSIRPYKGLERLIADFRALDHPDSLLLIAGKAIDEAYEAHLRALVKPEDRIRIQWGWIEDQDMQLYFNACDIVVLPFSEILTSGSALAALSFGRPVIAPACGCMPEILNEQVGILYDPVDPGALRRALQRALDLDLEQMSRQAFEWAKRFTWEDVADCTLQAYRS